MPNWSALSPFRQRPGRRMHLTELAGILQRPHPTLRLWLQPFVKEGILQKERKGRLSLYALNHHHRFLAQTMTIVEKMALIERLNQDSLLAAAVEEIQKELGEGSLCLIFGSAVTSLEKANDLDIFVVGTLRNKERIEKLIGKSVHLAQVSSLSDVTPIFKQQVIRKHLLLSGSEELLKWMYEDYTVVHGTT